MGEVNQKSYFKLRLFACSIFSPVPSAFICGKALSHEKEIHLLIKTFELIKFE